MQVLPDDLLANVLIAAPGPWLRKVSKRRRRGRASASGARVAEATTRELLGRQAHFLRRQPPRGGVTATRNNHPKR
jgi:hypothetical protein